MNTYNQSKKFLVFASIFALLATVLSSFVVHILKGKLSTYQLSIYQTGVYYQFMHSFALLGIGLAMMHFKHRLIRIAGNAFILGIVFFCGSLYAVSILQMKWIDILTPIGGLSFILGWVFFAIGVYQSVPQSSDKLQPE